ncbi:MAG: endonuclease, partial [Acidobacteria bacterium CG_4_9_14_3_um_filter_49_7]
MVAATPVFAQGSLFFSEYVEGSSYNKAVEIYNNTGSTVDLATSNVTVEIYFNGALYAGQTISLTGSVADGEVFVLSHTSAAATILAVADQTSSSVSFNGDDAVVLKVNGTLVDCIGQIGSDPGTQWGSGDASTADNTLRRKSTICIGDTNPNDAFDPAVEWDGYAINTFDGLGSHTASCGGPVNLPVVVDCDSPFNTMEGIGGVHQVSASDADGTIADIVITDITPTPAAGT